MRHRGTPSHRLGPARHGRRLRLAVGGLMVAVLAGTGLVVAPAGASGPAPDPATRQYEIDFLTGMIDHHQMAVEMAPECVEKAVHAELQRLCSRIEQTQSEEIDLMLSWLEDWYGVDHEPMVPAGDMQVMEHLGTLSGAEYERAFLSHMVEHHQVAVVEGTRCLRSAHHVELKRLCLSIVQTQTREIVQMRVWLCRWYGVCASRRPAPGHGGHTMA